MTAQPPAWMRILHHLDTHGRKSSRELQDELNIPRRTIFGAIQQLRAHNYVRELPNFRDMRVRFFEPTVTVQS